MMRFLVAVLAIASAVSAAQLKQETNEVKIDSIGDQLAQSTMSTFQLEQARKLEAVDRAVKNEIKPKLNCLTNEDKRQAGMIKAVGSLANENAWKLHGLTNNVNKILAFKNKIEKMI